MGTFDRMNALGIMAIARVAQWLRFGKLPLTRPTLPTDGLSLNVNEGTAIRTLLLFSPRELLHGHSARVYVDTVDDTDTYTVGIGDSTNSLDFDYAASANDTEVEILEGLKDALNTGVDLGALGGATLTFADADPDTITRSAGDWAADGLQVGDRITPGGTASNDVEYTVATVATTVLTLVADDAVVAEGPVAVTSFLVKKPIVASTEDRDSDSVVDTLLITYDPSINDEVADPDATWVTTVSTAGAGALSFDEDATSFDIDVYYLPKGIGSAQALVEKLWVWPQQGSWSVDSKGLVERADTAAFQKIAVVVSNVVNPSGVPADAALSLFAGPAVLETD